MSAAPGPGEALRVEAEVAANRREGGAGWRLRLRAGPDWPASRPGQFVMLSPGAVGAVARLDPLLPRPMAIYATRPGDAGAEVDVLYQVTGRGTALLAEARPGERVRVVGPLGRGFPEPGAGEDALLVGGGTGIASLYDLAARGAERGARVAVLLGARGADHLMGRDDFAALDVELRIATEDGSEGTRGLVTELLEQALAERPGAAVYACGPTPMMRRAAEIAGARGATCHVSLENRMACGFGICLGCAVPRAGEGFDLVCREGPVFEAGTLAWDGLP